MTNVIIQKTKPGEYRGFTCTGHAGHAQAAHSEKDVVCASVSVLVINTINALDTLTNVRLQVASDEKEGRISCVFLTLPDEKAKVLTDAMVLGLKAISEEYGTRFCKLKFEEV